MEILELFKRQLATKSSSSSKNTIKNYVSDVRHFISWFEAVTASKFDPTKITPDVITLYQNSMGGVVLNGQMQLNTQLSAVSMKRHLSSIRKFFTVLEAQKIVHENPFTKIFTEETIEPTDYWHIKSFRDYLISANASKITVKNYLSDISGFAKWYEEAILPTIDKPLASNQGFYLINQSIIEDYRKRLSEIQNAAPRTINRKLSALRRYLDFATKKGFITTEEISVDSVEMEVQKQLIDEPKVALEEMAVKLKPTIRTYSPIPPIRLFQKLFIDPYLFLEDNASNAIATLLRGKEIVGMSELSQKLSTQIASKNLLRSKAQDISSLLGVRNVEKEFYAPEKVSLSGLPFHRKLVHHVRFTRPNWYKRYHNYAFVHYIHFALLVIFASGVGVALYQNLVVQKQTPIFAAATAPPRILSFQGRLTDTLDNPITSPQPVRFMIYNSLAATGAAELWEETRTISPDQDGIFSVLLGSDSTGANASSCGSFPPGSPYNTACLIPSTVFSDNSQIWLGVTIGNGTELSPRQKIATVGYATNSEFLQGLPPTSAVSSFVNAVLSLDSTGSFNLNDGIEHTFQVSNGTLTLKAQTLNLTTSLGTNGNIILNPEGLGKVDIEKPIINNSNTGNLVKGGVEINDKFGILATESAVAAFVVNNNTTGGDIIAASSSGTTRFKIANDGTITSAIYTGQNGVLFGTQTTGVIAQATTASTGLCLQSGVANPTWGSCGGSYWDLTSNALSPINDTFDLLVGGHATSSAKFAFINNSAGAPTASIAGNLAIAVPTGNAGTNNFNLFNGSNLNFQTSPGGNTGLTSRLFLASDGRIGIGTINPFGRNALDVRGLSGTSSTASISATSSYATLVVDNAGSGDLIAGSSSGVQNFVVKNNGDIIVGPGGGGKLTAAIVDPYLVQNQKTSGIQSLTFQTLGGTNADFIFQNTSTTLSTLTMAGQFQLPITGSTGGIVLGGDTQLFRGAADRIDVGTGDSFNLVSGSLLTNGTTRIDSSGNGTFNTLNVSGGCTGCVTTANSPFSISSGNAIIPGNTTVDFLIGGVATTSAKFAVLNINSGTPTASVSAQNAGGQALVLSGDGTIQATRNNTLTLGGSTTGALALAGTAIQLTATNPVIDLTTASTLSLNTVNNRPITTGTGLTTLGGNLTVNGATTSLASTAINLTGSSPIIDLTSGTTLSINTTTNRPITTGTGLTTLGGNLTVVGATTTFSNAAPLLTTNTNTDLTITPNGSGNLILTSDSDTGIKIGASTNTLAPLSVSGGIGSNALSIFNQINGADILAASASGVSKFVVKNDGTASSSAGFTVDGIGNIQSTRNQTLTVGGGSTGNLVIGKATQTVTLPGFTTNGGILYTNTSGVLSQTGTGTATQCLLGGAGTPTFGSCAVGTPFYDIPSQGITVQSNTTEDFLLGGVATSSAKFAVLNIAGGTPTASISAQNAGGQALVLGSDGSIQTTRNNNLTLGGNTTGSLVLAGTSIQLSATNPIIDLTSSSTLSINTTTNRPITTGTGLTTLGGNLTVAGATTTFSNAAAVITSNTNTNLTITPNGTGNLILSSDLDTGVKIGASTNTLAPLSVSGGIGSNALSIFNQINGADILAASASGVSKFVVKNDGTASSSAGFTVDGIGNIQSTLNQTLTIGGGSTGNLILGKASQTITLPGFTTNGGLLFTNTSGVLSQTGTGTATQCLLGGAGTPTFGSCATGVNASPFYDTVQKVIVQGNTTEDFLLGGVATTSAKFAVLNIAGGTPTASISAQNAGGQALVLGGDGSIQSVRNNTLTIGGNTTGALALASTAIQLTTTNPIIDLTTASTLFLNTVTNRPITTGTGLTTVGGNLTVNGATGTVGNSSAFTLTTGGNADLTLTAAGSGNLILTSDLDTGVKIGASTNTLAPLSVSGGIGSNALAIFNQINGADILAASASGVSKFVVKNDGTASSSAGFTVDGIGNIQATRNQTLTVGGGSTGNLVIGRTSQIVSLPGFTSGGGILYTTSTGVLSQTGAGTATQCLLGGAGTPTFGSCATGVNASPFYDITAQGVIVQGNTTEDFLLGATASTSAKFAVINIAGGTPTASVSSGLSGTAAYFDANGNFATKNKQSLTLGGGGTGNITVQGNGTLTLVDPTINLSGTTPTFQTLSNNNLTISAGSGTINLNTVSNGNVTAGTGTFTIGSGGTGTLAMNGSAITTTTSLVALFDANATTINFGRAGTNNINLGGTSGALNVGNGGSYTIQTTSNGQLNVSAGSGTLTLNTLSNGAVTTGTGLTTIGGNLTVNGTTQTVGNSSAYTISTAGNADLTLTALGSGNLILTSDLNTGVKIGNSTNTLAPLSVSGGIGNNASLIINQLNSTGNIIAASSSGTTKFTLDSSGNLALTSGSTIDTLTSTGTLNFGTGTNTSIVNIGKTAGTLNFPGTTINFSAAGFSSTNNSVLVTGTGGLLTAVTTSSSGLCLTSNSAGSNPSWQTCPGFGSVSSPFDVTSQKVIVEGNTTYDFLLGGVATSSAKFAVLGIAGTTTPTASISAQNALGQALILSGDGSIQSSRQNTLTLGGSLTGNIAIGTDANARGIFVGNTTGTSALTLDSGTGAINIGTTIAKTLTIGNTTGATALNLNSGTGGISLASTSTGDITLNSSDTLLLDSAGVLELNSSAGVISIGNDAVNQNINIGTGGTRSITIGNTTSSTALALNSGTGAINIGTSIAKTITIGNTTGSTAITLDAGTGAINIGTSIAKTLSIGNATGATTLNLDTGTGGINFGDNANTKTIDIGGVTNSGTDTINIATNGSAADILNIGNSNASTTVAITGGTAWGVTAGGALTVASCSGCTSGASGTWVLDTTNKVHYPINNTVDLIIGGVSTASAQFSVLGLASQTNPSASISAQIGSNQGNGIAISGNGTIQSFRNNTLTIGGNTTGNISLMPLNGGTLGGYVGIGTATPLAKLHIVGNASENLLLDSAGVSGFINLVSHNLNTGIGFLDSATSDFRFEVNPYANRVGSGSGANGTTRIIIKGGTGRIGIGPDFESPLSLLHLNGGSDGGNALAIFDQRGAVTNDIFTASASGITRFVIANNGNVGIGTALSPTGKNPTAALQVYALSTQPIASISGKTSGPTLLLTNDGTGDIFAASVSGVQKFRINSTGDLIIGDGSGKIYGGGFDPLYTIDGKKFSTYATSINGMKEEYIGSANLAYDAAAGGYAYTLDFNNFEYGSELWTFSRVIDPDLTKVNVLLTPTSQARTWFRRDPVNRKLILYSDRPTTVTYRFTAPRFDYALYPSSNHSHDIAGLQAPAAPNTTGSGEADPADSFFASLSLQFMNGAFTLLDGFGNAVHRVDGFSNLIVANLEAGYAHIRTLAADSFTATTSTLGNATASTFAVAANTITIGGQDLRQFILDTVSSAGFIQNPIVSPLAEVDTIKTNTISPLALGDKINIKGKLAVESNTSATDSSAVSLEVSGSASISGSISSNSIQTSDATVSGTLRAGNVIANNISGLDDKISSAASKFINNPTANLTIATVHADFGIFEQGITSMGPITSNILTATDQLSVGSSFTISNNSINTVGSDLAIQSLRQGDIAFEGGLIRMDTDGNMSVNGNFNLLGEIDAVHGVFSGTLTTASLATNLISPVGDSDISVSFKDSKFNIQNSKSATASSVLTIDNKGNIQSSGSATFAKLNFNLVGKAEATSLTEAVATGSAGFATLRSGQPELTIKNHIITSKSLIYITPFGNTDNKVLYLLRQVPESETEDGSFTVGVSGPVPTHDMQFNWLIVN